MRGTIVIVFVLWSSTARANPDPGPDELFRRGRELMAAGKIAEACRTFEDSQQRGPAASTLLNLGGCYEKLGRFATALSKFLEAEHQAESASDAKTQQLHDKAQEHARTLQSRVSKLTISVLPQNQLPGLDISRDMSPISAASWNQALPIDGGTYTIRARAPGVDDWSIQITIAPENERMTVEIPYLGAPRRDLDEPPGRSPPRAVAAAIERVSASPDPSPHVARRDAGGPEDQLRMAGMRLGGTGAVLILTGLAFNRLIGAERFDQAVLFGSGAVALVTGGAMYLVARSRADRGQATVAPVPLRGGGGASVSWRW